MKMVFAVVFASLIVATLLTLQGLPAAASGKPVLYWVTDPNPVRQSQVDAFHEWMVENIPEEDHFELRVDSANNNPQKVIIQGVSGVGGDIIDTFTEGGGLQYYVQMGLIDDVSERAAQHGFQAETSFDIIAPKLKVDDRQYMYPCNVTANMFWVNKTALAKYGMTMPNADWTLDDFVREAKDFRDKANEGLPYPRFFYANALDIRVLMRNFGVDTLNETLSGSPVNDPGFVKALRLMRKWSYEDRILPTLADMQSFTTESAHGGAAAQLFRQGNFAMYYSGRWALCQFRLWDDFKDLDVGVIVPPDGGFRNTNAGARGVVLYAGGKHKELAAYFFKFLASPAYSQTVVESADALPPRPEATKTEGYLKPAGYENEWGLHETFSGNIDAIGCVDPVSPLISARCVMTEISNAREAVLANPSLLEPDEAAEKAARRTDKRIQQNLVENSDLQPWFDEAQARQKQIDELKAAGKKIPASLISNDFYLRYYRAKGMLLEDGAEGAVE